MLHVCLFSPFCTQNVIVFNDKKLERVADCGDERIEDAIEPKGIAVHN